MLSITCPGLMYFITGNYRSPRPPLSLEPLICSLYPHSLILNFNGRLLCVRGTGPGLGAEEAELPQTRSLSSNAIKYKRRTWQACQRESSLTVLRQMCYERWGGGADKRRTWSHLPSWHWGRGSRRGGDLWVKSVKMRSSVVGQVRGRVFQAERRAWTRGGLNEKFQQSYLYLMILRCAYFHVKISLKSWYHVLGSSAMRVLTGT